jgi:hypothetical protein
MTTDITGIAPAPAPTASDLTGQTLAPEAARARIEELKGNKEFYAKIQQKDLAAHREWRELHRQGYPAAVQVASVEDVQSQEAQRNAEQWNGYIAAVKAQFPLTAEQETEIRSGVVDARVRDWAENEKQRMLKDRGFRTKYFDGDRAAAKDWGLVVQILSLKPVRRQA